MRKISISLIVMVLMLVMIAPSSNAMLNFETTNLGTHKVGGTFDVKFTNSIYTSNEKTKITITYDPTIVECVSSSDPNLVLNKVSTGVTFEAPNGYSATLTFKALRVSQNPDEYAIEFKSDDNGSISTLKLGFTIVEGDGTVTPPADNKEPVKEEKPVEKDEPVEKMPNTGSLDYIIPGVIAVMLVGMFIVYRKNKSL